MKKRKIFRTCAVAFALLIAGSAMTTPASAAVVPQEPVVQEDAGVTMSTERFNQLYGESSAEKSPASYKMLSRSISSPASQLQIHSIQLAEDNTLTLTASVLYGGKVKELNMTGVLCNSEKQKLYQVDSVVGYMTDTSGNFEVLLFDLYRSEDEDLMLADSTLNYQPHMKLYLQDEAGELVLFETEIPSALQNLTIEGDEHCHSSKDALWFTNVIVPTVKEVPVTDEVLEQLGVESPGITPYSVTEAKMWSSDIAYDYSFVYAGSKVGCLSMPYGYYVKPNVASQGSTTWTCSFKISESVRIDGKQVDYLNQIINYRNVGIAFVAGNGTGFPNSTIQGKLLYQNSLGNLVNAGNKLTVGLLDVALSQVPVAATINELVKFIINANKRSGEITLGETNKALYQSPQTVVGFALNSGYCLSEGSNANNSNDLSGHYLLFQSPIELTQSIGVNVNGLMRTSWTPYVNNTKHKDSRSHEILFTYTR